MLRNERILLEKKTQEENYKILKWGKDYLFRKKRTKVNLEL